MNRKRLTKLQGSLTNPILIKKPENLFYLTGRSLNSHADEYLLVTKRGVVGFGSGLEKIDWTAKSDTLRNIGKYLKKGELDIEYGFTYAEGLYLERKIKDLGLKIKVKPGVSAVDRQRMIKEVSEITLVKKSMQIVEKVFGLVRHEIKKPGMTEIQLAGFIRKTGSRFGAEDVSFPPIVAGGANAAIPHHVPSNKKLKKGESIILDFGFKIKGYCSDFTRTVFLGSASKKAADAYNQVEKAYLSSMEYIEGSLPGSLKAAFKGIRAGDVYRKSVDVLAEKHLEKYFIHSLGHGTGLEIHELPNLSPGSKDIMQDGMVFSIEPGVYVPKQFGIRIEDLVYLEDGKVKKFINVPTELSENIL